MTAPSGAPVAPSREWPRKWRDASRVAECRSRLGRREKRRRLANFWQELGGYGSSHSVSGLASKRALLYAMSRVRTVDPRYAFPASLLATTNARSARAGFSRHIGNRS